MQTALRRALLTAVVPPDANPPTPRHIRGAITEQALEASRQWAETA